MVRSNVPFVPTARGTELLRRCKRSAMAAAQVVAKDSGDMAHVACLLKVIDLCDVIMGERADDLAAAAEPRRSSAKPKKSRRHDGDAPLDMEVLESDGDGVQSKAS